ncbi:HAD hydrolase family protein [Myxococcota bacterium]|nr:HAD hydrolase family protein [Myxococcota bacterium]
MSMPPDPSQIEARAKRVQALVLDVDGVLTDGRLTYLPGGGESKTFHVRDGLGIQLLLASGVKVALISGRESEVVVRRARELGIMHLSLGIADKVEAFEELLADFGITDEDVAYAGDDLPDLPLLRRVGLAFAVADAAPEVRASAHIVLRAGGGQGAVREACERILKARGAWKV